MRARSNLRLKYIGADFYGYRTRLGARRRPIRSKREPHHRLARRLQARALVQGSREPEPDGLAVRPRGEQPLRAAQHVGPRDARSPGRGCSAKARSWRIRRPTLRSRNSAAPGTTPALDSRSVSRASRPKSWPSGRPATFRSLTSRCLGRRRSWPSTSPIILGRWPRCGSGSATASSSVSAVLRLRLEPSASAFGGARRPRERALRGDGLRI